MKSGLEENDLDSSPGQSLTGSFRKINFGIPQSELDSSPGHSINGSFRKSSSVVSSRSMSGFSTSSKLTSNSRRMLKALKDYARSLINLELFTQNIEDWVLQKTHSDSDNVEYSFKSPFSIDEMRELDLALEGVLFQQLYRMPCSAYASDGMKEDEYFAVEDFLCAIVSGLWRTFWRKSGPLPYFISCPRHPGSKFYTVEKAISRGSLEDLCGLAIMSKTESDGHVRWDQVLEYTLFRSDILSGCELKLSSSSICEAIFYGVHILIARRMSKFNTSDSDSVFVLVFDSKYGGVVKLGGDIGRLDVNSPNPYLSVSEWIKHHADVEVSSVDQVWNKLGNANWGDLGTLQILLATFYSMIQWNGPPRKSISTLASDHSFRIWKRRAECHLMENQNALVPFQQKHQGEIVEFDQGERPSFDKFSSHLKLRQGEILLLDDQQQGHKSFQIKDSLVGGSYFLYTAISLDYPAGLLTLYVGAHPSRLEPSWEDMSLWYQVQRQTKVLNILKQHGVASKHLPEIVASGRILHSGPCKKQNHGDRCDHPWCGTPILVASPVGEPLSFVVARDGAFSAEEATRCCRDCLMALRSATVANVQHGDICPENIVRVIDPQLQGGRNRFIYVPTSWGRAVLEDRDSPSINLRFSSSHALQHGKLCPSSDAESLIYLLFFICGGTMQQQESIESALQWREESWAKRLIQQKLGDVSALLKAFADYVDSLCGTPYPVDYDIWLNRLSRAMEGSTDRGKMIEQAAITLNLEDVAESSGTSGAGSLSISEKQALVGSFL
ncbi:hypothetical protein K2173_012095 [Erythroxylum novogranatense]|uniref:Uncharacterized protein n=1 Tax=Erythroxylum novogranatense TaxID=1862640 RepID=A0AAV8TGJ7_9ROSI|nr:hypothetical protein K2173_012095 [Erythroxylum novogranatense]